MLAALPSRPGPQLRMMGLPLLMALPFLVGCANSPTPARYVGLSSAPALTPNSRTDARRIPYAYEAPGRPLARYSAVHLRPVAIYEGPDHQFGSLSRAEKAQLAAEAQQQFHAALQRQGILAAAPGPAVVQLQITLTGAQTNVPVLATATKLTPAGFALNGLQAVTDGEGRFSGMVIYAVELRDGPSQTLLSAQVTKQYPHALNIAATLGPLDAAHEGLKAGAESLAQALATRLKAS